MEVSSAERVVYPEDGITKGEVVAYYEAVSEAMWPYLEDRAITVERYPKGIGEKGFMQKNAPSHFKEDLVSRHRVPKDGGITEYPVLAGRHAVPAFANLGVITFHVPPSTVTNPTEPDWVIWDLDPEPGTPELVKEAARQLRSILEAFGIASFLMTSGSNGYHLRARSDASLDSHEIANLARGVAALAAAAHPDLMTLEFKKVERKGRVFVDWLRNAPYSTSVVPWSLRARAGAPVATPLGWEELGAVDPDGIRLTDALDRLGYDPMQNASELDFRPIAERVAGAVDEAGIVLEPFDRFRS